MLHPRLHYVPITTAMDTNEYMCRYCYWHPSSRGSDSLALGPKLQRRHTLALQNPTHVRSVALFIHQTFSNGAPSIQRKSAHDHGVWEAQVEWSGSLNVGDLLVSEGNVESLDIRLKMLHLTAACTMQIRVEGKQSELR